MRQYKAPFNLKFEDKLLGGKLTIRQGLWFAGPVVFAMFVIQNNSMTTTVVNGERVLSGGAIATCILVEIILLIIASIFSFIKVNGKTLDVYAVQKVSFLKRKRKFLFDD